MSDVCYGCGSPLEPSRGGPRRKWCSERCRKTRYASPCVDCGRPTNGSGGFKTHHKRCARCAALYNHESRYWTPAAIVGAIQYWADRTGGIPPAATDWLLVTDGVYPAVGIVQREFGTWNAAIAAAGFSPRRKGTYGRDGEDDNLCREICDRYEAGERSSVLAREYGCTLSAIRYRILKVGGKMRTRSEALVIRMSVRT